MGQVRHGLDGLLECGVADLVQKQGEHDRRPEREDELVDADDDRVAQHPAEERILKEELEVREVVPGAAQDPLDVMVVRERHQHAVDRQVLEDERQRDARQQHEIEHPHALRPAPALGAQGIPQLVTPGPRAKPAGDRGFGCRLRRRQRYLRGAWTVHSTAISSRRSRRGPPRYGCRLSSARWIADGRCSAARSPAPDAPASVSTGLE